MGGRPHNHDRQQARDRDEHVEDAKDPASDVLRQFLLELGLSGDGDDGVAGAPQLSRAVLWALPIRARPAYHPDQEVEVATMSSPQDLSPLNVLSYEPGACNIGPEEIARRRRAGHAGLIVSVGLFALVLVVAAPHWMRLVLVVTAAASASGYLQAWLHFCAGFGSAGVYNLGPLGTVQRIVDPQARSRDRRKSLQIGLASLAIGLAVGIGAVLLPIR